MASNHLPSCEHFTFKNGDVRILITDADGQKKMGMVCSQAMCLASLVWAKFIHPPFQKLEQISEVDAASSQEDTQVRIEGASTGESESEEKGENTTVKQLDFSEDDPTALLVLLRIAHLDFVSVEKKPDFEVLRQIAVLCDQYDCVQLVSMFLIHWFADASIDSQKSGRESWLFIAWVFGREKIFVNLADRMVKDVEVSESGEIVGYDHNAPMVPGIIESILDIRKTTIQLLLQTLYDYADRYHDQSSAKCVNKNPACDAITYGSLVLALDKAGLWPRKSAAEIRVSIEDLSTKLGAISIYHYNPGGYHQNNHFRCNTLYPVQEVDKIMNKIPTPVLDSHLVHMAAVQSFGI